MIADHKTNRVAPRVRDARSKLTEIARGQQPHTKLPSLRELSAMLSFSQPTIISALDQMEARRIIYRKDRSGIFVSPQISEKMVHVILGDLYDAPGASPVWGRISSRLIKRAEERAQTHNEHVLFHFSHTFLADGAVWDTIRTEVAEGRCDGVIGIAMNGQLERKFREHEIGVIAFAGAGRHHVVQKVVPVIPEVIQRLHKRGCTRVALWIPGPCVPSIYFEFSDLLRPDLLIERLVGDKDAISEALLELCPPSYLEEILAYSPGDLIADGLVETMRAILSAPIFVDEFWSGERMELFRKQSPQLALALSGDCNEEERFYLRRQLIQARFPVELSQAPSSQFDEITAFQKYGALYSRDPQISTGTITESDGDANERQLQGYELAMATYQAGNAGRELPDGLVILDDLMTNGALAAFNELGIQAGRDVHIASTSNAGTSTLFSLAKNSILMSFNPDDIVDALFEVKDKAQMCKGHQAIFHHVLPTLIDPGSE